MVPLSRRRKFELLQYLADFYKLKFHTYKEIPTLIQ